MAALACSLPCAHTNTRFFPGQMVARASFLSRVHTNTFVLFRMASAGGNRATFFRPTWSVDLPSALPFRRSAGHKHGTEHSKRSRDGGSSYPHPEERGKFESVAISNLFCGNELAQNGVHPVGLPPPLTSLANFSDP
uniref:(northern house mosquito) hypothetical protein n=1 Tax=Culex pipiens TaxID=7175 RepID=A0A8D8C4L6_CULPI